MAAVDLGGDDMDMDMGMGDDVEASAGGDDLGDEAALDDDDDMDDMGEEEPACAIWKAKKTTLLMKSAVESLVVFNKKARSNK